jgi:hypothetical protein
MQVRTTKHKVSARLANCGAVQKQPDVTGFRVHPALFEAVRDRLRTNAVALQTLFNTLTHAFGNLMSHSISSSSQRQAWLNVS